MTRTLIFLFSFIFFSSVIAQQVNTDSVLTVLSQTKNKEKRVELLMFLSMEYEATDLDKAFDYAQKATREALKYNNDTLLSETYNNLANVYEYRGLTDSSLVFHQKALDIRLKHNNPIKIGDSYNNIGIAYDKLGDFPKALENYFKALRNYEAKNDIEKQAMVLSNIGIVYKAQKEYEKAIEYYKKANKIYQDLDYDFGMAVCQGNLGAIFLAIGDYQGAIDYSERAIGKYKKVGYERFVVYSLNNIAVAYDSLKNYEKAEKLYRESVELYKKYHNTYEIGNVLSQYGLCLLKQGKLQESIRLSTEALPYIQKSGALPLLVEVQKNLAQAYAKMGDFSKAYEYSQAYAIGKDSLFEQQKTKAVFELEKQYETEKKENEILKQRATIAENNLHIEQKNFQIILVLSLLITSVMLGYLFFYRVKQKAARLEKENQLKDALAKIETQKELQRQRATISRDLHDNIGSQLTFITSSLENVKYYFKEANPDVNRKIDHINTFTKQTILELRDTIWAMNKGEISFEDLKSRISNFISNATKFTDSITFDFSIDKKVNQQHSFSSLEGINLYRVVQEAVNNAIKHAEADKIEVNINPSDKKEYRFRIAIQDNGKGMQKPDNSLGNGLQNMKNRISEIGGTLEFHSKKEEGTSVIFYI